MGNDGDVDPTGDRTYRDDQPKVYFADLRHEVDLAARRHAEMSTALDIYADELSHIAFAVTGDRDAIVGFDQIVDHVKAVVVERDELRAALTIAETTLSFFASVIKSGEAWTEACEDALRAALNEATNG